MGGARNRRHIGIIIQVLIVPLSSKRVTVDDLYLHIVFDCASPLPPHPPGDEATIIALGE
jgi:hypothetical protein